MVSLCIKVKGNLLIDQIPIKELVSIPMIFITTYKLYILSVVADLKRMVRLHAPVVS